MIINEHLYSCFWHSKTTYFRGGLSDWTQFGCSWVLEIPTSLGCLSSDQEDARGCSRGLSEVTQHGVTATKNTHVRFPSRFPPPRSPVNLFCEILRRVSASLAAPPSPETRSLRRARLIFARRDCDGMESGERGDDRGGVMWCRSGKSEWELIVCCGSERL